MIHTNDRLCERIEHFHELFDQTADLVPPEWYIRITNLWSVGFVNVTIKDAYEAYHPVCELICSLEENSNVQTSSEMVEQAEMLLDAFSGFESPIE